MGCQRTVGVSNTHKIRVKRFTVKQNKALYETFFPWHVYGMSTKQAAYHERRSETHARVAIWIPKDQLEALDKARGVQPRAEFALTATLKAIKGARK